MDITDLRRKYPVFTYKKVDIRTNASEVHLQFHFHIEPDIHFRPTLTLPVRAPVPDDVLTRYAFNIGLVEAISYWKSTCSPHIHIEAGALTQDQIAWWKTLFIHGLGEFFYVNAIDWSQPDFLSISSIPSKNPTATLPQAQSQVPHALVLVGGGKDSAVTLEMLKNSDTPSSALLLNPTPASLAITAQAGYTPIIVKRTMDPMLLELNSRGFLNGHTPFSALLAFVGITTALLHGATEVIASNEDSASEGNILFHGAMVNHQFSKSFKFEKMFRQYVKTYVSQDISYYSFLRPLLDLQITKLFTQMSSFHHSFNSCNVGRGVTWCGQCPKCAFVYLCMSAYLSLDQMRSIFGQDLFTNPTIQTHIAHLAGLDGPKPFECVGTVHESIAALFLVKKQYEINHLELPDALNTIIKRLALTTNNVKKIITDVDTHWNTSHFLPPSREHVLKQHYDTI